MWYGLWYRLLFFGYGLFLWVRTFLLGTDFGTDCFGTDFGTDILPSSWDVVVFGGCEGSIGTNGCEASHVRGWG